jgi:hypothetical protein
VKLWALDTKTTHLSPLVCYMPRPSHPSFDHPNNIW